MRALIHPHCFSGTVRVPASKSHTIRRLLIAALGEGTSVIDYPLDSLDARSCVSVCKALGAEIREERAADSLSPNPADERGERLVRWVVKGGSHHSPRADRSAQNPEGALLCDVGNSGTTLFLALAAAALGSRPVTFTGDEQIRRRSAGPLLDALAGLGVRVESAPAGADGGGAGGGGYVPITVEGPWKGGRVSLPCPTSQYLSALLLASPLASPGALTEIDVPLLNERPYIEMTLSYLDAQGIPCETREDFSFFRVKGGASWKPWNGPVPGDFSSAAFPGCAAAISGGPVTLLGLDPEDPQGDKAVFRFLAEMGCEVEWEKTAGVPSENGAGSQWKLTVSRTRPLKGGEFDLNATPDLLPVMAVTAAFAQGDTALVNAAHARIKETDRIAVMAQELAKLGVSAEERPDGLFIRGGGPLRGGKADGRKDHRIVMALAAGALGASGPVEIAGAESAAVTYPGFLELLQADII
jgi:3-phosphoshikimate 1-carboxyvinyltransferase